MKRLNRSATTGKHHLHDPAPGAGVKLMPGDFHASAVPMEITTVLGSCVAACLHDPVARVGGMNHFMLPVAPDDVVEIHDPASRAARYGTHAMELLINRMVALGALRERLQAKVFGGAKVLRDLNNFGVGTRNACFVLEFLQREEIPLLDGLLGGEQPLKVCMEATTGKVMVRRLSRAGDSMLARAETRLATRIGDEPVGGSIELFGDP